MKWTKRAGAIAICIVLTAGVMSLRAKKIRTQAQDGRIATPSERDREFDAEIAKVREVSLDDFTRRFAPAARLAQISFDPTTAKYWDLFSLPPEKAPRKEDGPFPADFRLNKEELALFKKNGFVVSERMGAASFGEAFYRIYSRDLPVFISCDALLHAWHRSYDEILLDLEQTILHQTLNDILRAMSAQAPAAAKAYSNALLSDGLQDADYFLTVAQSLLSGKPVKSALGGGTDSLVAETLKRVEHQSTQEIELFGRGRVVDFSQFKPRGHYTKSERLQCYFRAMMWCGRIDFEVGSEKPDNSSIRELAGALVLHDLLKRAKKEENWRQFDQFIRAFVGPPDSMNFDDLQRLARSQKMADLAELKDASALFDLQQEICRGDQGRQAIAGSHRLTGSELPRSWTFLGQRFVIDSWAMGKVVEDQLELNGKPVPRRIASAVDVAFMVLGNNSAAPILAERIRDPNGRRGRDGLQFQHHATAVRNILDRQSPSAWEQNLYWGWLGVLRELSVRSHDGLPEVMRTEAWEMKNLSSQLASWTQLRHDTILYADQVMVSTTCCYPSAFVEPRVDFWRRFETMARRALDLVNSLSYPDITLRYEGSDYQHKINGAEVQKRHAEFFENFASRLATLRGIAGKEIGQQALTAEETKFLQDTISVHHTCAPRYSGWYPELFFKERKDCATWDALVADVLTVPPDAGDPGCILHQGVGNVDMMLIAIDNGGDKAVYAGPVFSYYEFETAPDVRKTDAEWRKQINEGKLPARPAWTAKYLAPGSNPDQANYRNEEDWGMTREEFERITRQIK